ncbi:methyltransferase family protein [Granulosicoccus sp. 3-233]|uniref:methyltransferase family protein n=1 Tax=Granulosicoccus sp. 3-233 TaxID=3417969 RepID=UPI003D33360D
MKALELRIPPAVVALIAAIGIWLLSGWTPFLAIDFPLRKPLAVLLALCGGLSGFVGIFGFRVAHTTVDPLYPATARALVTGGIYRYTRNPMYVGIVLILLAWVVFLGNFLSLVMVGLFVTYMNRFQILPEEKALTEKFGDQYRQYRQQVRRWI